MQFCYLARHCMCNPKPNVQGKSLAGEPSTCAPGWEDDLHQRHKIARSKTEVGDDDGDQECEYILEKILFCSITFFKDTPIPLLWLWLISILSTVYVILNKCWKKKLFHWSIVSLVHWSINQLVHWSIGLLAHWSTGQLIHWSIGPLVHWFIGPLVHWLNVQC